MRFPQRRLSSFTEAGFTPAEVLDGGEPERGRQPKKAGKAGATGAAGGK